MAQEEARHNHLAVEVNGGVSLARRHPRRGICGSAQRSHISPAPIVSRETSPPSRLAVLIALCLACDNQRFPLYNLLRG